ncbi:MAG: ARMT1-like domain-containing protein [Ignisphaera sp.]
MKLYAECIACQINIRLKDIERLVYNEDKRVEMIKNVVEKVNDRLKKCRDRYDSLCIPTVIATDLFRYIKHTTGLSDPYRELKKKANEEALKIYREIKQIIESIPSPIDRLHIAIKISLIGNTLDTGVAGYTPPDINEIKNLANSLEIYGDIDPVINIFMNANDVAILMDNSGEAVFDKILADVLKDMGKKVIAIVKGGAFQNDITIEDVSDANLHESFDKVIDTGSDASSIFLDEVKPEVIEILNNVDVVVAKGMANYEYITEIESMLKKPVVYMLVAKCRPIARDIGVPLGKAVVKIGNNL